MTGHSPGAGALLPADLPDPALWVAQDRPPLPPVDAQEPTAKAARPEASTRRPGAPPKPSQPPDPAYEIQVGGSLLNGEFRTPEAVRKATEGLRNAADVRVRQAGSGHWLSLEAFLKGKEAPRPVQKSLQPRSNASVEAVPASPQERDSWLSPPLVTAVATAALAAALVAAVVGYLAGRWAARRACRDRGIY